MEDSGSPSISDTRLLLADDDVHLSRQQQNAVLNKLSRRVVILSMGIIFVSSMDRGNLGLAASELCNELHLSHAEYGRAVGLFYAGFIASQVASNVMLQYYGAPVWFSFIVFAWGCVATASAFIRSVWQFYLVRILLGVTEGGTFPGVFYYLGLFFPDVYIEEAYASVIAALSFATPISALIGAGLLSTDGILGTTGWRNLFFVEGLIPIAFAVVLFFLLPKSIESITFLNPDEKRWLSSQSKPSQKMPMSHVFTEIIEIGKMLPFWRITFVWSMVIAYYVVLANWITLIIHDGLNGGAHQDAQTCGVKDSSVLAVVLTAVPYALNGLLCYGLRKYTHRIRNRTSFNAKVLIACASLLITWVVTRHVAFVVGFLFLTATISLSGIPNVFVSGVALTLLPSESRSTGMALGNGTACTASVAFPMIIGLLVDRCGYGCALPLVAGIMFLAACFSCVVKDPLMDIKTTIGH